MDNNKELLIVESQDFEYEYKGKDKNGQYVLEGIFGEIDKKNRNNRIYTEDEYVPQIEKLQKKIEKGKLVGELDHPNTLEVRYNGASHIIDSLWYDKENKQVRGKIRLMNTYPGENAKAMVDAGVQLSISSRAAGVVGEGGNVKLKNLVTYDLVSDPGFENAELACKNEEFGISESAGVKIYELGQGGSSEPGINNGENKGPAMGSDDNYITKEKFQEYTETVRTEFEALRKEVESIKESGGFGNGVDPQRVSDLEEVVQTIGEGLNKLNDDVQGLDKMKEQLRDYTNYLRNGLEKVKNYSEHNNSTMEKLKRYAEHNNEVVKTVKDYAEKVDEDCKVVKKYAEHVKESARVRGEYQDKVNEEVLDKVVEFADKNNEKIKELVGYAETAMAKVENLEEGSGSQTTDNSSSNEENEEEEYERGIKEKLQQIAESAKQQEAEGGNEENFLNFLSKENRDHYSKLEQEHKDKVIEMFTDKNYSNVLEADSIFEEAIKEVNGLDWYEDAPKEFKDLYETLDEEQKRKIKMQAQIAEFNSQDDIKRWWESRNLNKQPLNRIDEGGNGNGSEDSFEEDPLLNNPNLNEALKGIGGNG